MRRILFVCTGNTCRSSMAEALAKKLLEEKEEKKEDIEVISAGIAAFPGMPAAGEAIDALSELGIDLKSHRSALLTPEAVREADLVLTMTARHRDHVRALVPGSEDKVFTLGEYAGQEEDISDPIGQPIEVYRECARKLKGLIEKTLARFEKNASEKNALENMPEKSSPEKNGGE